MEKLRNERIKNGIRGCALSCALLFLAVGIWRKEYLDVLGKAVRICLECIGIG